MLKKDFGGWLFGIKKKEKVQNSKRKSVEGFAENEATNHEP